MFAWDIYQKLLNVLTATAVFRYTRLVLTPLVQTIFSERAKFIPRIRGLVQNMTTLVEVFNRYWTATMVDLLQVFICSYILMLYSHIHIIFCVGRDGLHIHWYISRYRPLRS